MTTSRTALLRRLSTLAAVAALFGATALLSACNTTAGAGQDISAAGKAVSTGADKVKGTLP